MRSGGQHPLFAAMEPNWVETYTREDDGYKTVESALLAVQSRRRILPESRLKYEQTGDANYLQCMTRLVIRTDLATGRTVGFFMMILPSVRYLEATKFKPFYGMTYQPGRKVRRGDPLL